MKLMTLISLLLMTSAAFAAGGAHGEVPTKTIIYQAINVVILFAGLIYFLRKPVREHFAAKRAAFLADAAKSQAAREAAEREHKEIKERLAKLENSKDESIARAKADAADLRNQLMKDAEAMSKKIQEDAKNTAANEVDRAKKQLRDELLRDAVLAARKDLSSQVSSSDQQRLQDEFVSNIKTVQP